MARAASIGETPASTGAIDHDVVVAGGGTTGLPAAIFLTRYGLDTRVLASGKSAITQCARLENYLGFPGRLRTE